MKAILRAKLVVSCLVFLLAGFGAYGQPEFSLDDFPTFPINGPVVPPFGSAEDEFGVTGASLGPSPSIGMFGFFDSDVLMPGPALMMSFPPPPFYVDAYSANHFPTYPPPPPPPVPGGSVMHFTVDRASMGIPLGAGAADILRTNFMGVNFVIIPGGAAGLGLPFAMPNIPPPRTADNVDAYNEFVSMMMGNIYYALNPGSAFLLGFSPADIFLSPPGALIFAPPPWAFEGMMGLGTFGFATDSIDSLVVWDNANIGVCDPGADFALFTLSPNSASLMLGPPWDGATIFWTDFTGIFIPWANGGMAGLAFGDNIDGMDIRWP
jgi:hypothetical protein